MSATAAVHAKTLGPRRSRHLTPEELCAEVQLPHSDYVRVPRERLAIARQKIKGLLECNLYLLIIERTFGGERAKDGTWRRPLWVRIPKDELPNYSRQAIEDAAARLEKEGLINSGMDGREKLFALKMDLDLEQIPDREKRPGPPKKSSIIEVPPGKPIVLMPGARSRPAPAPWDQTVNVEYWNDSSAALKFTHSLTSEKLVRFHWEDERTTVSHDTDAPDMPSGLRISTQQAENSGSKSERIRPQFTEERRSSRKREQETVSQHSEEEMALMRDMLNRWCRRRLGPVDDEIVRKCCANKGNATLQDCARRLSARLLKVGAHLTYGLVAEIIADAGKAAGKADQSPSDLSPEELAEWVEWTEKQKKGRPN